MTKLYVRDYSDSMINAGLVEFHLLQEKDYQTTRFSRNLEDISGGVVRLVESFRATAVMKNTPQFLDVCFTNADDVLVGKLAFTFLHNGNANTTIHVIKTRLDINAKPIDNIPVVEANYCTDENNIARMISEVLRTYHVGC